MATRGAFGFRSAKQPEKADQTEGIPMGLSRRSSITSNASNTTKLPTHSSSFFSRSKLARAKVDVPVTRATTPSNVSLTKTQSSTNLSSIKSEPGVRKTKEDFGNTGLGISMVNENTAIPAPRSSKNVLRRKAPLDQRGRYARTESSASSYEPSPLKPATDTVSSPGSFGDPSTGSVFGVSIPSASNTSTSYLPGTLGPSSEQATSSSRMASFNTRKAPDNLSTQNLPPPTPTFVHDSGSSTRRSESPGGFSRTSTPTSMSSQSPGVTVPVKVPLRTRQQSPAQSRPPITTTGRTRMLHQQEIPISQNRGLTAVRESATSSSSSSTVKGTDLRDGSQVRSGSSQSTSFIPSPPLRIPSQPLGRKPGEESVPNPMVSEQAQGKGDRFQAYSARIPPPRPNRDGAPGLDETMRSPPAIHTYLPPLQTTGLRRRGSNKNLARVDTKTPPPSMPRPPGRSPSNASSFSTKPSRMPSPNLSVRPVRPMQVEDSLRQELPALDVNTNTGRSHKDPSPLSAGSSKSSSRFGLFTKRTRSPLEATVSDISDKAAKKGPAAGTGHEGYGKYARRGRSGSASTSASRGRSTSSNSIGRTPTSRKSSFTSRDEPEIDNFFRDRVEPVVISGGAQANDNSASGSAFDATSDGEIVEEVMSSEEFHAKGTFASQQYPLRSQTQSAEAFTTHHLRRDHRKLPHRTENPMDKSGSQNQRGFDSSLMMPTLAARRSAHRSQMFGQEFESLKVPAPIDTQAIAASPTTDSRGSPQSSFFRSGDAPPLSEDISEGHEGNWFKSQRAEKRSRSPRKWNFFQRAQASPRRPVEPTVFKSDDHHGTVRELPATVSSSSESRPVAFYALLDGSEQEGLDRMIQTQNAVKTLDDDPYSHIPSEPDFEEPPVELDHKSSMLLPSPPKPPAEFSDLQGPLSPSVTLRPPEAAATKDITPAPTLEPKKPRLQQVGRIPRVVSKRDRPHMPPPQSFSRPFARRPAATPEPPPNIPRSESEESFRHDLSIQTEIVPSDSWGGDDPLHAANAPTGHSDTFIETAKDEFLNFPPRIGSEVSGSSSSGVLSFAATTAVVPEPGTAPNDDEIWNEYNEFLDTVQSPGPSFNDLKKPIEKTLAKRRWAPAPLQISKDHSVADSPGETGLFALPATKPPTKRLPSPPNRSKLLSPGFPNTPGTISDLLAGYGDRNRSSAFSKRQSRSTTSRYSTSSKASEADTPADLERSRGRRDSSIVTANSTEGLGFQTNLRFDALMTSRWLSFDRVLFSPARLQVNGNRVLVLDGLGNDDWSYYCAGTYSQAEIINLSPRPGNNQAEALQLHKNHRHVQYSTLGEPFPFATGFFTAAVVRFPAAASETAYVNAISECFRVLRSGGYLELSILDLDMVNMGNRARKALRELKLRLQAAQPDVSLKPLLDDVQKMVGREGFENLNRCVVNVPVAGYVSNSRSGSLDAKSGAVADTMKDTSTNGSRDLAKNLASVGRWWYTNCYESMPDPYGVPVRSIWADNPLLEECERMETGFKLLLCYAQKPTNLDSWTETPSKATDLISER